MITKILKIVAQCDIPLCPGKKQLCRKEHLGYPFKGAQSHFVVQVLDDILEFEGIRIRFYHLSWPGGQVYQRGTYLQAQLFVMVQWYDSPHFWREAVIAEPKPFAAVQVWV